MTMEHFDVLIIGAGLSGIGAAVHLKKDCPNHSFALLEGRAAIGGTWDLFRYPGIRSDSDMYTLGYDFKPWEAAKAIADGPSILSYVNEAATENDIVRHIRFGHKISNADWDSAEGKWTVTARLADGSTRRISCNFLYTCCGYYNYDQGYQPEFAGLGDFKGRMVYPQFWPEDLDYSGKNVVVIGSGATAVTLVPSMAETAKHVTMLQRSPTYVVTRPAQDAIADWLRKYLPAKLAYTLVRIKNVGMGMFFYRMTQKRPEMVKAKIIDGVRDALGPDYDIAKHFTPKYNPWDQRLCLVPDADLFETIKNGRATVVTDHIDTFTPTGIKLKSGAELPADVVVSATGLQLIALGGIKVAVDGIEAKIGDTLAYKGMMFSNIPNLVATFGYINASWTLRADLIAGYTGRLLNHMRASGNGIATPRPGPEDHPEGVSMALSSGYVQRGSAALPKQGTNAPWKVTANYAYDYVELKLGRVDDGKLIFSKPTPALATAA